MIPFYCFQIKSLQYFSICLHLFIMRSYAQILCLSVSLAPTPTCQYSLNLASIASLGQGYSCIRFVCVCLGVCVSDLG